MKKRALVSVSDKRGVVDFCKGLVALGYEIISTGGTARTLTEAGVANIGISDITGFPECLDGRVKTLHPYVHAGLLAMRSNPEHMKQLEELNVNTIDVVAVNLYPFKATIMKEGVTRAEAVENIDIGGPTMLRSAAKNYQDVIVVCDPDDYTTVLEKMNGGEVDLDYRMRLMYKVYQHTASYDTLIATYLREQLGIESPDHISFAYEKAQDLRYGENPHQSAVFYKEVLPVPGSLALATQLNGKELSFNNINDANGALGLLREFDEPAVVAVKHTNPCGVAVDKDIYTAYCRAYAADPTSIFGGIVAANREIDLATAKEITKIFLEIVIAPSFTEEALAELKRKPNLRVLELPSINAPLQKGTKDFKKVVGGLLVQDVDNELYDEEEMKVVTKTQPDEALMAELAFCYKVVKHAKSNAIAISKDRASMGIGVGQTNRIWATQQAIEHSLIPTQGAVLASDAFFPFSDCVEEAHKAGIRAIIQPGGSIRDQESIEACDKYGIVMVFVGKRHFKH